MIFLKILIISILFSPNFLLSEDLTWKYLSKTNNGRAFISEITSHESEKKHITFFVMYDSYKGLTAANGAKYFSKKENYTVNCSLREFYISFVTAWDGRNGNGKIVFNHDKSKNNQGRWNQTNPGSFEETLLSNACNDSGAKEIIDKIISGGKS
jgi:hypothetical protein